MAGPPAWQLEHQAQSTIEGRNTLILFRGAVTQQLRLKGRAGATLTLTVRTKTIPQYKSAGLVLSILLGTHTIATLQKPPAVVKGGGKKGGSSAANSGAAIAYSISAHIRVSDVAFVEKEGASTKISIKISGTVFIMFAYFACVCYAGRGTPCTVHTQQQFVGSTAFDADHDVCINEIFLWDLLRYLQFVTFRSIQWRRASSSH